MTLSENLSWRGFVNQTTYKDIKTLDGEPVSFYLGVDPSADSMTVGNLAIVMMVRHFIEAGHKAYLLVGGATGMIGDPDGKKQERDLLTLEQIDTNKQAIAAQYKQVLAGQDFKLVDNYDWFKGMGYLEFLRDVGKHVPMRQMLGRDFIQSRLGDEGGGISYAEFSYSLIQGYDFLHLHREHGVTLQVCGADQWGNSIAGVELIRRITGDESHIWSAPLVINKATGVKFGKSEDGAIWLDENKTSVYKFYQFWLNVDDESATELIKLYTMLSMDEITEVLADFAVDKAGRRAQKVLAYEVTKIVHGEEKADSVVRTTAALFGGGNYTELTDKDFSNLKSELPLADLKIGADLISALTETKLATSNSEARRFLEQGSIYMNGQQVSLERTITAEDCLDGHHAVLRRGKNANALLHISE
ncbi:MAG: tyrosine--tRNA ligase [Candidatus Saccharimonadales bacterium]